GLPPLPGGIAVEGAGTGGSTPAAVGWLHECPIVVYWGDLDAAGLTILHQHREAGLDVISILMDIPTYDTYAEFGTNLDAKGNPIKIAPRKPLPTLNDAERALYERLTDPAWRGYRRVEQERIPLDHASAALCGMVNALGENDGSDQ
ncbi:MAG TPA: Wadjet anti-phage system protein JetD domain-containing protein, partial [Microlunatus sp.]|nr:Wadjet anti-phage system protein JetD domain-containing protein [Microlunatus sp.]